ncbi:hypothetical protein DL765_003032 [Monosporascus sp. GIB2]|nr:hypothetical protein DL765_003032 [Monosporascus sp. GIB2]
MALFTFPFTSRSLPKSALVSRNRTFLLVSLLRNPAALAIPSKRAFCPPSSSITYGRAVQDTSDTLSYYGLHPKSNRAGLAITEPHLIPELGAFSVTTSQHDLVPEEIRKLYAYWTSGLKGGKEPTYQFRQRHKDTQMERPTLARLPQGLLFRIFSHLQLYGLASVSPVSRNLEGPAEELLWAGIGFHGRCYQDHTASRAADGAPVTVAPAQRRPVRRCRNGCDIHGFNKHTVLESSRTWKICGAVAALGKGRALALAFPAPEPLHHAARAARRAAPTGEPARREIRRHGGACAAPAAVREALGIPPVNLVRCILRSSGKMGHLELGVLDEPLWGYENNDGLDDDFWDGIDDPEGWRYYKARTLVLGFEEHLVFPNPKLLHLCKAVRMRPRALQLQRLWQLGVL